ncbi:PH domain-containing protein [Haloferax larsenii]|uniref:PH domain-containing protein n=1 Tax=Haloferax larsenii TaxID=302484 RepID=A0ABY5RCG3_HALLR|nr:PH domain-containing protein [Haloferax larsenii]UVE49133.1 PH domain-containing protein [Haloferax larsenii]
MSHLSPLSVPYRAAQRSVSIVFAVAFFVFSGGAAFGGFLGAFGGIILLGSLVLAIAGYELAYYQRFEYELTPDTFDIRSGVFGRRNREIPYRRIQNVDISRNVAQRLFGIAAVNLETAGGGETEGSLRFVSYDEALRIQTEVARLKRGETAGEATEPDREVLFELAPRELGIVGALSFDLRLPGLVFVFVTSAFPVASSYIDVPLPTSGVVATALGLGGLVLLVALVSWGAGFVRAVVNYYDFRLTRVGDELQYERGLLQRYNGSIPLDKLQTLTIEDNPLKRHFGFATLLIETAGYAPSGDSRNGSSVGRGSEAAIPLARRERVRSLVDDLEGVAEPTYERPPKRIRRRYAVRYSLALGAIALALFGANTLLDRAIPWYVPLALVPVAIVAGVYQWRHRGYGLTDDHVVTRNGFWKRETRFVPYYRIQTIIDTRTIFQRRWRVATVTADTAGSLSLVGGDAAAVDIGADDAVGLRETLNDRLRDALAERREERRRARQAALGVTVDAPDVSEPDDDEATEASTDDGVAETPTESPGSDDSPTESPDTDDSSTESPDTDDSFVWGDAVETPDEENEAAVEDRSGTDSDDR